MKTNIGIRNVKQLGVAIRRCRLQGSLTQSEVGKKAGVKQNQVSNIEQGLEGVRLSTLFKVLSALDVEFQLNQKKKSKKSLEDLFNG